MEEQLFNDPNGILQTRESLKIDDNDINRDKSETLRINSMQSEEPQNTSTNASSI